MSKELRFRLQLFKAFMSKLLAPLRIASESEIREIQLKQMHRALREESELVPGATDTQSKKDNSSGRITIHTSNDSYHQGSKRSEAARPKISMDRSYSNHRQAW